MIPKRILITRSPAQAQKFADKLAQLGADPVIFPVIQFEALPTDSLETALNQLDQYDWLVFTSVNAVKFFWRVAGEQWSVISDQWSGRVASVGSATAQKLAQIGLTIDFIPDEFTGEQLVLGLGDVADKHVLLPRAKIGRPEIVNLLEERGALVDDIPLYDTVTAVPTPDMLAELDKGIDAITFTSPSSVRNFLKIAKDVQRFENVKHLPIYCIGPVTAEEVEKNGLVVTAVADPYTIDGLINAMEND